MISLTLDNPRLTADYDTLSDAQFANGRRLLALLNLQPGQTVLDIGCGTGRLTRHAAELVTASGQVIALDPLATRVEFARQNHAAPNIAYHVAASHELGFVPDAGADAVYLNAVFHWVERQRETLAAIRRVLKPGGRLGLTTGAEELNRRNPLQQVTASVLQAPPFNLPLPLSRATRHRVTVTQLIELLLAAGLAVDGLSVSAADRVFATPADALRHSESSSFGNYLAAVPGQLQNLAREKIQAALAKLQTPRGLSLPHHTIFALARRV